ncbi:MAG: hypothetical protein HT580_05220 [Dechloromonas sp.]|nr:MAG: hypothetical protein HT580_05220 [Dechloromonas sp.]
MTSISEELAEQIRAIREDVVMKTLAVTLVAYAVLLLGNMVRNVYLGNSLSIVHPVLYLTLYAVFLLRAAIGAERIAWLIVILLYLAATVGLFVYGLAGNSAAVYMAFCFVSTTFFGVRGGGGRGLECRQLCPGRHPAYCRLDQPEPRSPDFPAKPL